MRKVSGAYPAQKPHSDLDFRDILNPTRLISKTICNSINAIKSLSMGDSLVSCGMMIVRPPTASELSRPRDAFSHN